MPKEIVHIKHFHGGINDASEPSDISDHEAQVADSCDVSNIGKITLSGDLKGADSAPPDLASLTQPGSGLFTFTHDRDSDGTLNYVTYYVTHHNNIVSVWDSQDDAWLAITVNGSGAGQWNDSSGCDVNFLFDKGVLRSSDGQLVAANQRKWWGYISRSHFGAAGASGGGNNAHTGMKSHDADIPIPGAATLHVSNDPGHAVDQMGMRTNVGGSGGSIPAGTYRVGYTFIYDNHQESGIRIFNGSPITITEGQVFAGPVFGFHTLNSRIVGSRVYIQENGSQDDFSLLVDIDLVEGYRLTRSGNFTDTFDVTSEDVIDLPLTGETIDSIGLETYSSINGYVFNDQLDCSYKTAVIVDGITYAGNIFQNGQHFPDRVIKCAVNSTGICPDIFPQNNFIPTTSNDGDEVVKLETFADKVLVFKRQNLFVVNYSESLTDYIESSHPFMGIRHKDHSIATAHGIVFMNESGVFIYDGEKISSLAGKAQDAALSDVTMKLNERITNTESEFKASNDADNEDKNQTIMGQMNNNTNLK